MQKYWKSLANKSHVHTGLRDYFCLKNIKTHITVNTIQAAQSRKTINLPYSFSDQEGVVVADEQVKYSTEARKGSTRRKADFQQALWISEARTGPLVMMTPGHPGKPRSQLPTSLHSWKPGISSLRVTAFSYHSEETTG